MVRSPAVNQGLEHPLHLVSLIFLSLSYEPLLSPSHRRCGRGLAFQATLQVEPADKRLSLVLSSGLVIGPTLIECFDSEEISNLLARKTHMLELPIICLQKAGLRLIPILERSSYPCTMQRRDQSLMVRASRQAWRCPARRRCTSLPAPALRLGAAPSRTGASSGCAHQSTREGARWRSPRRWGSTARPPGPCPTHGGLPATGRRRLH